MLDPGSARCAAQTGMRFAIFDLDGTLHPEALGVLLLKELRRQGVSSDERTEDLFDFLHRLGAAGLHEPENVQTAYQMYARVLEGCSQHQVEQVARQTWERTAANVYPYAEPLLDRLRARWCGVPPAQSLYPTMRCLSPWERCVSQGVNPALVSSAWYSAAVR